MKTRVLIALIAFVSSDAEVVNLQDTIEIVTARISKDVKTFQARIASRFGAFQRHLQAANNSHQIHVPRPESFRRLEGSAQCDWTSSCSIKGTVVEELRLSSTGWQQYFEQCKPCWLFRSMNTCLANKACEWSPSLGCDCMLDSDDTLLYSMAGLADGCGWFGKYMKAVVTCSKATSCTDTPGCELKEDYEVPENPSLQLTGMQCKKVSKCSVDGLAVWRVMCPGVDVSEEWNKCVGSTPKSLTTEFEIMQGTRACMETKCKWFWEAHNRHVQFHEGCKRNKDATSCVTDSKPCAWEKPGQCEYDMFSDFMYPLLPDGCPWKEAPKCVGVTQSSCESTKDCKWEIADSCNLQHQVYYEEECKANAVASVELLVKGSCDVDYSALALIAKTKVACMTHTEEDTCKAQLKPTLPPQPTCAQLVAQGANDPVLGHTTVSWAIPRASPSLAAIAAGTATIWCL